MEDFIPALSPQTQVNELGTLHHNTISRKLNTDVVLVEPRPTLSGNTKVATGNYGRGAFVHRGLPLYVTESKIATSLANTTITDTELNPNAAASFSILDSGSDRITIVQNAGYDGNYGNIYFSSNQANLQVDKYADSGNSVNVQSQVTNALGLDFSDDGLTMYVGDSSTDIVYQYTLSTAWDVSTATYANKSYDFSSDISGGQLSGFTVVNNGTLVYVVNSVEVIYEFPLSTAYDISTVGTANGSFNASATLGRAYDLVVSGNGSEAYVHDQVADNIEQYNMSTPFDITTMSAASKTLDLSGQNTGLWLAFDLSSDGGTLFACCNSDDMVYEYTLSTPWDLSTGSYASRSLDVGAITTSSVTGLIIGNSDKSVYMCSQPEDTVVQFDETDSFTKVSDSDSPGHPSSTIMIRGVVVLNGRVYCGDINGNILNSDEGSVTAWTATSTIAAERKADYGCAIVEHKDHICWIGTRSIEFFYDASISNASPLQRRQDIYHNVGCVFPNSVSQKGDIVYFFGTDQEGETDVYIINQFGLSPLGNEYIKSLLRDLATPVHDNPYTSDPALFRQTLVAYTTPDGGTALNMTINGTTYNYSINSGHIAKWYPGENVASSTGMFTDNWNTSEILPIISIYSGTAQGSTAYAILSNGYTTSFTYDGDLQDIGGTMAAGSFFYSPKWNAGSIAKKKILRYDLHQYPSYASADDPSNITFEWVDLNSSDQIGASLADADFSNNRTFSALYANAYLNRCGVTRERMHKLTFTPQKGQLVEGVKVYYDFVGK